MKGKIITVVILLISLCASLYLFGKVDEITPLENFICSLLSTTAIWLIILLIKELKRRWDNGIDLMATLEQDPEKLKAHMLFIMRSHGVEENLKELNDIFRNYPQWDLSNWEVFRAWYKATIDHMLEFPHIYHLTLKKDGSPYIKENDPLYDPEAPDWEPYDRHHYYDDDYGDDDINDDDYTEKRSQIRKAAQDGLFIGIGLGGAENLLNN